MAGLRGNISLGANDRGPTAISSSSFNSTLEEPVTETIMKDLKKIGFKLKFVLMPRSQGNKMEELRDWDLWGPLLFCLLLALTLSISSTGGNGEDTASLVFGIVFVVVWFGAAVVTLNALLLGGTISFFQSVCVLGYCIFPMNIAAFAVGLLKFLPGFLKLLIVAAGFGWSTISSVGFMGQLVPEKRQVLAEYPVILFYLFLGWFILVI